MNNLINKGPIFKNKIRGFWLEDEPKEIVKIKKILREVNIHIDVYTNIEKLINDIKSDKEKYSIGIFDLLLTNIIKDDRSGINIATELMGTFIDEFEVEPHFGSVSNHRDNFSKELSKYNPFDFEYEKSQITEKYYIRFLEDIINHARTFEINKSAIKYHKNNPVEEIDEEEFELVSMFCGKVERMDDSFGYIEIWNPKVKGSKLKKIIPKETLNKGNIYHEDQGLRILKYEKRLKRSISQTIIESMGTIDLSTRILLKEIDYGLFEKRRN